MMHVEAKSLLCISQESDGATRDLSTRDRKLSQKGKEYVIETLRHHRDAANKRLRRQMKKVNLLCEELEDIEIITSEVEELDSLKEDLNQAFKQYHDLMEVVDGLEEMNMEVVDGLEEMNMEVVDGLEEMNMEVVDGLEEMNMEVVDGLEDMNKEGRREVKRYGVLFTCIASRAVHLESANSLDTSSFVNALHRFIYRRGPVRQVRSDQGSNFVGAKRELKEAVAECDDSQIKEELLKNNCDWITFKMNVPSASHMGGIWECQIRTVHSVLSAILEKNGAQLDDESLRTYLLAHWNHSLQVISLR